MKIIIYILLLACFINRNAFCQYLKGTIDTVYYFKPGKGQSNGQAPEYFPKNIFGIPDTNANRDVPAQSPEQICSIGLGGEIIVGFRNFVVENDDGPDFTIFENAFVNPVTRKIFAEPAKISVSLDGITYYEFPFDSLTLEGCAGVTPTNGGKNPFDPNESGGDSFDLATLNIDKIKYIKISDISEMILNNPAHPYYDVVITGFDLDAVVGLHLKESINTDYIEDDYFDVDIKTCQDYILIRDYSHFKKIIEVKILNLNGEVMIDTMFSDIYYLDLKHFSDGFYLIIVYDGQNIYTNKIMITR